MSALSYSKGPDVRLIEKTIDSIISDNAASRADQEAIVAVHQNVRMTWREFNHAIDRTASGLISLGLCSQDRVGIWSYNCVEWVLLQMACARAGLVLVNVHPAYRSHDLAFVLQKSRMRALVLWESDSRSNYRSILDEARSGQDLALEHVIWLGTNSWTDLLRDMNPRQLVTVAPGDVANVQYTSGTTGTPKGVLLTHRNLVNNAWLTSSWIGITEHDRVCTPCPLYHCSGSVVCGLAALLRGAALVLPAAQFNARATLKAIESEACTIVGGVPTMYMSEVEHPEFSNFDLTSLRTVWMGGATCPVELMRKVKDKMKCRDVLVLYGQTESSPITTMTSPCDDFNECADSIGYPLPNTEVKIISPESGKTLPRGQTGELCVRGYMVMPGYDDEPEATANAIDPEGWLHSGDLATMRSDGRIEIVGRAKDVIIRGGENISPREIEEFLCTNPKVAEVSVVGVPDPRLGEAVVAWIRLSSGESGTEEEFKEFCRKQIAHFKVPQVIRLVDSFPTTLSGKVQRFRIRQIEEERIFSFYPQAT